MSRYVVKAVSCHGGAKAGFGRELVSNVNDCMVGKVEFNSKMYFILV